MAAEEHDDGRNKHGFPQGYSFVPKQLELIGLLSDRLAGRPLPYPLHKIFHEIRILDFHPTQLYDTYKKSAEAGYIYFFSRREFAPPARRKKRPVRVAAGGAWKASGGGKAVKTMRNGCVDVGQKLTMVFYQRRFEGDRDPDKTAWGMHEFTRIIGPNNQVADMAVYCLYRMKNGKEKKKADRRGQAHQLSGSDKFVATFSSSEKPSTSTAMALPAPVHPAAFMVSQANVDSTSQTHMAQGSVERAQFYQQQYAFGAAAAAPGPSSWAPPSAAYLPAQHAPLYGARQGGYVGFTDSPAPSMASVAPPAANYPPPQQQAAVALPPHGSGHFGYAGHADCWQQPLQMDPPPPAQAPAAEGYMADAFNEWCEVQKQASPPAPAAGIAVADGRNEWCDMQQQASPAPAAEGYMADAFNEWCEVQKQASPPAPAAGIAVADGRNEWCDMQQQASPSSGLAVPEDDDYQLLLSDDFQMFVDDGFDDSFTFDELCGDPMDGAAAAMMVEGECVSNPADGGDNCSLQGQGSNH